MSQEVREREEGNLSYMPALAKLKLEADKIRKWKTATQLELKRKVWGGGEGERGGGGRKGGREREGEEGGRGRREGGGGGREGEEGGREGGRGVER